MDRITLDDLRTFVQKGAEPRVSLYVSQQGGHPASEENAKRLRYALFQAATKLTEAGYATSLVTSLLQPAADLARNGELWRTRRSKGLAMLFAPGFFQYWHLPFESNSSVDIGRDFRIAPLVRLLDWSQESRVLAFSATGVRFFRCTRESIQQLELPPGIPSCLDEFEGGPDVGRAVRFQTSAGATGSTHLVHGQTSFKDEQHTRLHAYVRAVARHIGKLILHEKLPLVLVAAKEHHPVFNDAYPTADDLLPGIQSSPAHLSEADIHQLVVRLVDQHGNGELRIARESYQSALERHHASFVIEDIIPAAAEGRVDTLIVAEGERAWGFWDNLNNCALVCTKAQPFSVDLIELAIRETMRHGCRVCVVPRSDIPEQARCVAALRWAHGAASATVPVGIKNAR